MCHDIYKETYSFSQLDTTVSTAPTLLSSLQKVMVRLARLLSIPLNLESSFVIPFILSNISVALSGLLMRW